MKAEDELLQKKDILELLLDTTTTSTVFILNRSTTPTPIGGVTLAWTTATSTRCAIQSIPAFRRIQEGLLVAAGGETVVTTHRGYLHRDETIIETQRLETSSGTIYDIKNVRPLDSHIEVDMVRIQND